MGVKVQVLAIGLFDAGIDELVKVASRPPKGNLFRVKSYLTYYDIAEMVVKKVSGKWTISKADKPYCP